MPSESAVDVHLVGRMVSERRSTWNSAADIDRRSQEKKASNANESCLSYFMWNVILIFIVLISQWSERTASPYFYYIGIREVVQFAATTHRLLPRDLSRNGNKWIFCDDDFDLINPRNQSFAMLTSFTVCGWAAVVERSREPTSNANRKWSLHDVVPY